MGEIRRFRQPVDFNEAVTKQGVALVTTTGTQTLTNKTVTGLKPTEVLTAARELTVADSGKVFFLSLAGGFAVTLPTVATALAGFHAKFIVKTAPTTAYTIVTGNGAEQKLAGLVHSGAGADEDSETDITGTTVTFVANTALINDWCEIECDGAGWYVAGFCNATGGITITG
jgi:alpha-D-ribose 1-methylphosphonate 5-triphosphate synthase subunit PhnH